MKKLIQACVVVAGSLICVRAGSAQGIAPAPTVTPAPRVAPAPTITPAPKITSFDFSTPRGWLDFLPELTPNGDTTRTPRMTPWLTMPDMQTGWNGPSGIMNRGQPSRDAKTAANPGSIGEPRITSSSP